MKKYLYTFKYQQADSKLFALEQKYLFKKEPPQQRYFLSDTLVPMEGSCFGEVILEVSKCEPTLEKLKTSLKELPVLHDAMLDSMSLGFLPKASFNDMMKILPALYIHANLVNPKNIYILTRTEDLWYLGRVVSRSDKGWPQHRQKPETMSSAIPHVLARTIVTTLKAMGHKSLIDYCCGSGTFLIEAASLNLKCTGIDLNPNMIAMSRTNIDHFNYSVELETANACEFSKKADCGVVDFPYGFHCHRNEQEEEKIIINVMNNVKTGAFICGEDFSKKFLDLGFSIKEKLIVPAVNVNRYIYLVEND
jgi:predicted RNA methylase